MDEGWRRRRASVILAQADFKPKADRRACSERRGGAGTRSAATFSTRALAAAALRHTPCNKAEESASRRNDSSVPQPALSYRRLPVHPRMTALLHRFACSCKRHHCAMGACFVRVS
jgi:hypothetical protein